MHRIIQNAPSALATAAIIVVAAFATRGDAAASSPGLNRSSVVRDHRGPNGAPQGGVTVNGHATRVTATPNVIGRFCHTGRGFACLRNTGEKSDPSRGVT